MSTTATAAHAAHAAATQLAPERRDPRPAPTGLHARLVRSLAAADITLNGTRPHDPQVEDLPGLLRRLRWRGTRGLGEAYVEGLWDADDLPGLFLRLVRHRVAEALPLDPATLCYVVAEKARNRQRRPRARADISAHYDQSPAVFAATLDRRRVYTCGYWTWPRGARAATLEQAQEAKLDLVCRKLDLRPGMRVLDIGCGWGSFLRFAAERYGVTAHGITLSREQHDYAAESCRGLPVEVRLQDYRDLPAERYDRVVSLGMFEHVGPKNHADFIAAARRSLAPDGLMLLHFFVSPVSQPHPAARDPLWVERYVFPGMVTPSLVQVARMLEDDGELVLEDLHNFGQDYADTLLAWDANFRRSWANDPELRMSVGPQPEKFYRVWRYYLTFCSAVFAARRYQLFQLVLSPGGVPGGYVPVR